jgi:hypothetical protein
MANENDKKDQKPPAAPEQKPAKLLVAAVRKNNLGKNVFYIKLNTGKVLNTRDLKLAEKAQEFLKAKQAVAFKEEAKEGKHAWLVELKAA